MLRTILKQEVIELIRKKSKKRKNGFLRNTNFFCGSFSPIPPSCNVH